MAKAKAKAKPKPEPKKVRKQLKIKDSARCKREAAEAVVLKKDDSETAATRILFRRDTDAAVDRCVRLKLGCYPRVQVDNNCNADGDDIATVVRRKIHELRGTRKHIPWSFWQQIVKDHHLTGELLAGLAVPPDPENVNKDLDDALNIAHNPNPAARSAEKILRMLEWSEPMNRTEFFGLIHGSVESPSMSAKMSQSVLQAVLKFIARTDAHKSYDDYWEQLSPFFDNLLAQQWKRAQSDSVPRINFIRAHRLALSLFMDMEMCTKIQMKCESQEDAESEELAKMTTSSIGQELFAPEMLKEELKAFVNDIGVRIRGLEDHNFDAIETQSFERIMRHQAESLDNDVLAEFDKANTEMDFCDGQIATSVSNMNDLWGWRIAARRKEIAISNGLVDRLPWEVLLWGDDGHVPGIPMAVRVPEENLYDNRNCREYALQLIGPGWHSVQMMKDTIFANRDALTKLDRSFWMELHFLEHSLDSKLSIHLQNCLMAILPEKGQVQSMTKAVLACRQLATGRVAMAAGKSAERELQGCCNLLSDCCEGRSPTASAVTKMSPFSMLFLKKAENFCVYNTVEGSDDMTGRASRKVVLTGANALLSRFDKCSTPHKDPDSADLKVFRSFRWMLNEDQNARVDEWLRVAVLTAKDKIATAKKAAITDIENAIAVQKGSEVQQKDHLPAPPISMTKKTESKYC